MSTIVLYVVGAIFLWFTFLWAVEAVAAAFFSASTTRTIANWAFFAPLWLPLVAVFLWFAYTLLSSFTPVIAAVLIALFIVDAPKKPTSL